MGNNTVIQVHFKPLSEREEVVAMLSDHCQITEEKYLMLFSLVASWIAGSYSYKGPWTTI